MDSPWLCWRRAKREEQRRDMSERQSWWRLLQWRMKQWGVMVVPGTNSCAGLQSQYLWFCSPYWYHRNSFTASLSIFCVAYHGDSVGLIVMPSELTVCWEAKNFLHHTSAQCLCRKLEREKHKKYASTSVENARSWFGIVIEWGQYLFSVQEQQQPSLKEELQNVFRAARAIHRLPVSIFADMIDKAYRDQSSMLSIAHICGFGQDNLPQQKEKWGNDLFKAVGATPTMCSAFGGLGEHAVDLVQIAPTGWLKWKVWICVMPSCTSCQCFKPSYWFKNYHHSQIWKI